MSTRGRQRCALVLGLVGAYVGVWAALWPRSFHTSFPGLGRHWVAPLGPYDEHLVRDVGAFYLALGVVSLWAAWRRERELLVGVGLGWTVFNLLHGVFHLGHLGVYGAVDQVANVVVLGGVTVLSALVLWPAERG